MNSYIISNQRINRGGRLPWIDWAKAIGIFLVVLGHFPGLKGQGLIYLFHMPFFFLISGYLYKRVSFNKEIAKVFRTLIIPYLFFNSVLLLIALLLGIFRWDCVLNILLGNQELLPARFFRPLWFLVSLFIMRIVCSLLNERYYHILLLVVVIVCLVLSSLGLLQTSYTSDYFQLQTTLICIPFFIIGYLTKKYNLLLLLEKVYYLPRLLLLIIASIMCVYIGYINGGVNVFTCQYGRNYLLFLLVGLILSIVLFYVCSLVFSRPIKLVEMISEGTILIIALHVAFIDSIRHYIQLNTLGIICCSCLVMLICIILEYLFLKYAPYLLGRRKAVIKSE